MKATTVAIISGTVGIGVGGVIIGLACRDYVKGVDDKFIGISKGLRYIQDNVDLSIAPEVAEELVKQAAANAAEEHIKKASEYASKEVAKDMKNVIKGNVQNAYKDIEETIKAELEKEINIQTIERIENKVSEKVAKQLLNNYQHPVQQSSKADIVKACLDAGMNDFEISRVMASVK